jgi:hypothetical protein
MSKTNEFYLGRKERIESLYENAEYGVFVKDDNAFLLGLKAKGITDYSQMTDVELARVTRIEDEIKLAMEDDHG